MRRLLLLVLLLAMVAVAWSAVRAGSNPRRPGSYVTERVNPRPFGLRQLSAPNIPRGFYKGVAGRCAGVHCTPMLIDWQGQVIDSLNWSQVRYDPRTHRFFHGQAETPDSGPITTTPQGTLWVLGAHMGAVWAIRESFSRMVQHWPSPGFCCRRSVHPRGGPRSAQFNDVAVDNRGNAWIPGWSSNYGPFQYSNRNSHHLARGLPGVYQGRASVDYVGARAKVEHTIYVPGPAPLTGATIGRDGSVWMLDPYQRCIARGQHRGCRQPRFVQYLPRGHRFHVFVIPPRARPHACTLSFSGKTRACATFLLRTPMATAPDGSIWALVPGQAAQHDPHAYVRLIHFRDGIFTSYRVSVGTCFGGCNGNMIVPDPMVGRAGRVWVCGRYGHPIILDPNTGKVFWLRFHGGSLLQDHHGRMWYAHQNGQISCDPEY